jgi:hypothetical protein
MVLESNGNGVTVVCGVRLRSAVSWVREARQRPIKCWRE